jgi:transcriptional regulator with XRE-family HTH domain
MDTLGAWLRQAREAKGSTLEETAAATRIRARFVEALEAGDFGVFPGGDVQVRGFLRIYARYLGLPFDEVLARYNAEVYGVEAVSPSAAAQTQPLSAARAPTRPMAFDPARAPTRPMTFAAPSVPVSTSRPRWLSVERLMIGGAALIALLAIVIGAGYVISRSRGEEAAPPAPATGTVEAALPPTAAPVESTSPVVTPTFPANPQGGVTLALEATEHVWVRVTADNRMVFEGMLASGQVETWSGQEAIVVETGNGAGLLVTVNEQSQGTMCGRGQTCTRAWGPAGEVTPP